MKYNFTVVDLYTVKKRDFIDNIKVPFVVISIVSPEANEYEISYNQYCEDILYLRFHDVLSNGTIQSLNVVGNKIVPINYEDTKKILDFSKKYSYIQEWLINCEAGMSRSAAVALALSEIMNGRKDYEKYIQSKYPLRFHNIIIKKTILNEYNKIKNNNDSTY